jgi:hypothetical protein
MAQTLLSPTIIVRRALAYFHEKAKFIGSINREYDSRFANSGASPSGKIGPSLLIRMPNQFTVRSGVVMSVKDVEEETQTLTVSTVKGVDFDFPVTDLTLTIDDFSGRYVEPAVARLVAELEADALSMYKDIANIVDGDAAAFDFIHLSTAQEALNDNIAPPESRFALLSNKHVNKYNVATKGLFNPGGDISKQIRRGVITNVCDFDIMSSSHIGNHTTGTAAKTTGYVTDNPVVGAVLAVKTGTTTFFKGDIFTIADVFSVHPETKASTGVLKKFAVTADSGGSASSLAISPAIVATGAKQNVSAAAGDGKAIVKVGAGASELLNNSVAYHKDAFTFVTADLVDVSKFGAWGKREQLDGISMSIARQLDITNLTVPCRIDVLYGFKTIRPELAVRIHADG